MSNIVYTFPGQGAQSVGMGKAFYDQSAEAKEIYKAANAQLGFDLTELCFEGPQEELTRTDRCQPALLVTSLAAFVAVRQKSSPLPMALCGLSLGEISALAAAEALSLKDAVYLVQARGEAMAQCADQHPGAMLAVMGLEDKIVEGICDQAGVVAANYNAPAQLVLSGSVEGIDQAEQMAKEAGAKRAVKLDVSGAFHSPLMQPAAKALEAALSKIDFREPKFPVVSNVTAEPVLDPSKIPGTLVRQLVSPVRWSQSVRYLIKEGADTFIELPPARTLTGLLKRIDRSVTGVTINEPEDAEALAA